MGGAVAVAVSGGRDSIALLHATARAAQAQGLVVHALHVHHGLVASADDWLRRLRAQCQRWARGGLPVVFHATRLRAAPAAGQSIEAWARRERYKALAAMAVEAGCSLVLLAHHRRDQAETLLLQALRGGGPAGLSAMPRSAQRAGITWARPWLARPREAIEAYVRRHRLRHVDDESNLDTRFARNGLRLQVWPALVRQFPDAETQLLAAAARAQEAAAVLAEVAAADLALAAGDGGLQVAAWQALSPPRRAGVLRLWLRHAGIAAVPESLVQRLADELPMRAVGRWPTPRGELQLYRGLLQWPGAGGRPARPATPAPLAALQLDLSRPGPYALPAWGGTLVVDRVASGGVQPSRLRKAWLRAREGGEQFQLAPGSPARSLKKQFQARGVAAAQRGGPLVFDAAGDLLFVPGLGLDSRALAAAGTAQCRLSWQPGGASSEPAPG